MALKIESATRLAAAKESKEYRAADLAHSVKKLRLGDVCTDDDSVVIIEEGYIRVNVNTCYICQCDMAGEIQEVQLNGPNKKLLIDLLKKRG